MEPENAVVFCPDIASVSTKAIASDAMASHPSPSLSSSGTRTPASSTTIAAIAMVMSGRIGSHWKSMAVRLKGVIG